MDESEHPFSAYSREDTAEQPQSGAPPLVGGPDQPEPPPSGIPQQRLRNRHHRDGSLREERREVLRRLHRRLVSSRPRNPRGSSPVKGCR